MEDYEIYRDNYEYMRCSPMVQSLLRDNRELQREIKELKRMLRQKTTIKMEPRRSNTIDLTDEIEIKTIHLTTEPNIVYDLIEATIEATIEADDICENCGCEINFNKNGIRHGSEYCENAETDLAEDDEDASAGQDEVEGAGEDAADTSAGEDAEEEDAEEEDADEEDADEEDAEEEDAEEEEAEEEEAEEEAEEEDAGQDEVEDSSEEEEGVYEVKIKTKTYYVTNETNGTIYAVASDGEVGDEVGKYVDGKPIINKKK